MGKEVRDDVCWGSEGIQGRDDWEPPRCGWYEADDYTAPCFVVHSGCAKVIDGCLLGVELLNMVLDTRTFSVGGLVEQILCMGSLHIGACPSLGLN